MGQNWIEQTLGRPQGLRTWPTRAAAFCESRVGVRGGDGGGRGPVSAEVAALAERMLKTMVIMKLKLTAILVLGVLCFGTGLIAHHAAGGQTQGNRS